MFTRMEAILLGEIIGDKIRELEEQLPSEAAANDIEILESALSKIVENV